MLCSYSIFLLTRGASRVLAGEDEEGRPCCKTVCFKPFHCLSLNFHCLSFNSHRLSWATHCLSLTLHRPFHDATRCLSSTFHRLFIDASLPFRTPPNKCLRQVSLTARRPLNTCHPHQVRFKVDGLRRTDGGRVGLPAASEPAVKGAASARLKR